MWTEDVVDSVAARIWELAHRPNVHAPTSIWPRIPGQTQAPPFPPVPDDLHPRWQAALQVPRACNAQVNPRTLTTANLLALPTKL
ncbi:BQ5605_C007g04837 [Microbotryum silenes-dioicae]|uniref:BQ5605_C007g04837 protein n=1 Tax=Microbotryum silenes-dioicae TaxID=796604 RepID=A0A2X0M821_9BASI|nr:BQ5605_C007g04837 [Microbotryum silenes-dioicae]